MVYAQMTAQASGLKVFSSQQLAIDHSRAAHSSAECQHDDVIRSATGPCVPFPQQGSSGVVFKTKGKIEFGLRPPGQVKSCRITILVVAA